MNNENLYTKPLKMTSPLDDIWVWSDLHLGQACESWSEPLWSKRGFSSLEDHDATLVERWNANLTVDSIMFHLGDIMFGMDGSNRIVDFLNSVKFKTLYLMPGNHYAGYKQLMEISTESGGIHTHTAAHGGVVHFIHNYLEIYAGKKPVVLSHYPILSWNSQARGSIMIHGHCHGTLHDTDIGKAYYEGKVLDVGVEMSPEPQNLKSIINIMKDQKIVETDHHKPSIGNPF